MLKSFGNIDELLQEVENDKNTDGINSGTTNRFPVRFVLFDNFKDSYDFISAMQSKNIYFKSVENWMCKEYDDIFMSRIELANAIRSHIETNEGKDSVITPFSELARFYDNIHIKEFDGLIVTLKAIQASNFAQANRQRIYIVVVGQYGKIANFENDSQIFIWYLKSKSEDEHLNYRLILLNGTDYQVRNLSSKYTIVKNIREWLHLWREGRDIKHTIISTSPAIYAYADNAQPDNAFNFCKCDNVYDFLINGLGLSFGNVKYKTSEDKYWCKLASKIDVENFEFNKFIKEKFHLFDFRDYNDFFKAWYDTTEIDNFDKWLLVTYYLSEFDDADYLHIVLHDCKSYNSRELFERLLLSIFKYENNTSYLKVRLELLNLLNNNTYISKDIEKELSAKLSDVAKRLGYETAVKFLTPFTHIEKEIVISWLGMGKIEICDIKDCFSDIYYYLQNSTLSIPTQTWIDDYISKYKHIKFSNTYNSDIENILKMYSSDAVKFNQWYQDFQTVRSILTGRQDIEIYYWIDGLGIDWIPVIRQIIEKQKSNGIYLNEVIIAKSLLPTITSKNKMDLEKLNQDKLEKIGDLDKFSHNPSKEYPSYIIDEFDIVKEAINEIINKYAGKKIAIISDHGISYLSQYCQGLNLKGIESDHNGRMAKIESNSITKDNRYVEVEDKIVCALSHSSLCAKVPTGIGAHGGATPEEVLVPIFIISNHETKRTWEAHLKNKEISRTESVVRFEIKGLKTEKPYIIYKEKIYKLFAELDDNTCYYSERIDFKPDSNEILLCVNSIKESYLLNINFGAIEEDLF